VLRSEPCVCIVTRRAQKKHTYFKERMYVSATVCVCVWGGGEEIIAQFYLCFA